MGVIKSDRLKINPGVKIKCSYNRAGMDQAGLVILWLIHSSLSHFRRITRSRVFSLYNRKTPQILGTSRATVPN